MRMEEQRHHAAPPSPWRRLLALATLVVALVGTAPAGAATSEVVQESDAARRPAPLRDVGIDQRLGTQVPLDLTFRDESGREVALGEYLGRRPVVLALVYYECPMLCTLVLNGLVRALRALTFEPGREFDVVAVSFEPRETPVLAAAKKATMVREYGRPASANGWHFLTGEAATIARLASAVGFHFRYVPEERQYAHAAAITVLTPEGRIARYFYGVEYAPRDLRLGLVEAARGTIGSPIDQLMLYCYRYDPATGHYGAIALNLVRAGGVATVLALGGFIVVMRRRERLPPPATRLPPPQAPPEPPAPGGA